jgi:hypothetical protein
VVIRPLLSHVVEHPDAKDTLEGIHKFWFPTESFTPSRKELEDALEFLVSKKGWFVARKTSASETVYSLQKKFLQEVKDCLENFS